MNDNTSKPTILVVFGITGDLSQRYLLPAIVEICKVEHITKNLKIVGVTRRSLSPADIFREKLSMLEKNTDIFQMDYEKPDAYSHLKSKLKETDKEYFEGKAQIIFYFAVPPPEVPKIVAHMGKAQLNSPNTKLLLEKPFGTDLTSAQKLINETARYYPEEQIYRIDHYLAKELAQNITVFLGSNTIFRDIWSSEYVESIEITAAEKISIEKRVSFYENTGALRDYQSHLLQLAALVLMEPCSDIFDFAEIPRRRLAALEAIKPVSPKQAIRGQYLNYLEEVNNPNSAVETFIDFYIESSDPRWKNVPIRLTTGKNLDTKLTQITVRFKQAAQNATNMLILRIQPKEGIEIDLWVKEPGYERKLQKLPLSFYYDSHFKKLPDAYEQVLVDAIRSNHSLFAGSAEILAMWRIIDPLIKAWADNKDGLIRYDAGSTIEEIVSLI